MYIFAAKYGYKPTWQVCCVGDFQIKYMNNTKDNVIKRLCELKDEFKENTEEMYDNNGDYTDDVIDGIEIILQEEYMGFMMEDAVKTKDIDSVISIVNTYYSME